MKTKLSLIFSAVILLVSCAKKGPSDETKKAVSSLDSSWSAMGMNAMAMNSDMQSMLEECVAKCSSMKANMAAVKSEMKMKCDSLSTCCDKNKEEVAGMQKSWEDASPLWMKYTEELKEFKAEVDNSRVTDEEAQAKLAEFQKRLTEGQAQMADWTSKYNTCKDMCMKNMTACAEIEAKMNPESHK